VASSILAACGASSNGPPASDAGPQPCTDDSECAKGQSCVAGFCTALAPVDGGLDAAGPPQIVVTPTVLTFGNPYVGGEYSQTFTIRNVGQSLLTVKQLDLVDNTANKDFSVSAPARPFTIVPDPQQDVTVTVTLRPTDNSIPSGVVHVISDDPATVDVPVQLTATMKDDAHLDVCVLNPTPPPDCIVSPSDGSPLVDLGNIPYGSSGSRVVTLTNGGAGNVAERISDVKFVTTGSIDHYRLDLFYLDGSGAEVPVTTFPYYLNPVDPSGQVAQNDLRGRITFTAIDVDGPITGVSLEIDADHPTGTHLTVPIIGQILGCRPSAGADGGLPDGGADPLTDPNNCGYCGHKCTLDHATATCEGGYCKIATCDTNYADCDNRDDTGCETDLTSTTAHCGSCGTACVNMHGTTSCTGGQCVPHCDQGYDPCGGDPALGCTTSLNSTANCGTCGATCTNDHGGTTCNAGVCKPTCATGFGDCDGHPENGCETDLSTTDNCNNCGVKCTNAHGTTTCSQSGCQPTCDSGFADCNGNANDGCETNLGTSALCGLCSTDPQCPSGFFCNGTQCEKKHDPGTSCTLSKECASGFCVDGHCCQNACDAPCRSCANATGTCTTVTNADDVPQCQGTSTCDAIGSCLKKPGQVCAAGTECASTFCKDGVCCPVACTSPCYSCSTGSCVKVTSGDDVPECTTTSTCNASGVCLKRQGQGCADGTECLSGFCFDGKCCDQDCSAACKSCATGTCTAVLNADDAQCTPTSTHTCDGSGVCKLKLGQPCGSDGTICASGVCKDGVCCNAPCSGTCQRCDAPGSVGTCTTVTNATDPDTCTTPNACDATGACRGTGGTPCDVSHPCGSGLFCVDGVCCNTACNAACQSCTTGACLPVKNGDDAECSPTSSHTCDSAGACKLKNGQACGTDGTLCASGICKDGVCCGSACSGACQTCAATPGTCTSVVNAEDNPECAGASICNASGVCKRKIGSSCSVDGDCISGKCCGGVCRDITSDNNNCGACGVQCTNANATAGSSYCSNSACTPPACLAGYQNCNGVNADGCEVYTAGDVNNCGGCGVICGSSGHQLPHVATYGCTGGLCSAAACSSGWVNITGPATNSDGCECQDLTMSNAACSGATNIQGTGTCSSICYNQCPTEVWDPCCGDPYYCLYGCYVQSGTHNCNPYSCAPTSACNLSALDDSGQSLSVSGNLPQAGDTAWYVVQFTNSHWDRSTLEGGGNPFHVKIGFSVNNGDEFELRVYDNCTTQSGCGSGGQPIHATTATDVYEWTAGENPCLSVSSPGPGYSTCQNHARTLYVQVSRRVGFGVSCNSFTIQATNGL
jgi:hypothetical protein